MNRTILIVICDFLLVSLLAFSTVDINKVTESTVPVETKVELTDTKGDVGKDLSAVMRQALDEERKNRDLLLGELARTRDSLQRQQSTVSEKEKQVQAYEQALQTREQETVRLQNLQTNLLREMASAQTTTQELNRKLQAASSEAVVSKELAASLQAEARKQTEQLTALQRQLTGLQQSNQMVLAERERLSSQLAVVEVERKNAAEQVVKMEQQVKTEREEKARLVQQAGQLAEGVKVLANRSGELAQEIRENRPLTPNTIYSEFLTNRVRINITAARTMAFGLDASKRKESSTVLVASGTNVYAVMHVEETPLTLSEQGIDWEGLTGTLSRGVSSMPISNLVFTLRDPRVILVPLTQQEARRLGVRPYQVSTEPYKFQDAVLVGPDYYGECRFEIDQSTPSYVRLDNNFIKGLFGKFNPSRGDLVLSRNGEVMGVMANSTYCLMLRDFHGAASLRFAKDTRQQRTGFVLSQLHSSLVQLPAKLQ